MIYFSTTVVKTIFENDSISDICQNSKFSNWVLAFEPSGFFNICQNSKFLEWVLNF